MNLVHSLYDVLIKDCGARTIDCMICKKPVKIKDVTVHMRLHKQLNLPSPEKQIPVCLNVNCEDRINLISVNRLGLCDRCFAPFWSSGEDEKGLRMKRLIVKTYHTQIMTGCDNDTCKNEVPL